jgi:hypothetical protein
MNKIPLLFTAIITFGYSLGVSAETVRERVKGDPKFPFYTVIFAITVDAESKINQFYVSKVTDPRSGKTDAVDVKIPEKYVEAARKKASQTKYEPKFKDGKPVEFYTYYFYSPQYPDVVITDLDAPIDKQP